MFAGFAFMYVILLRPSWFRIGETQYHKTVLGTKYDYDSYKDAQKDAWKRLFKGDDWRKK